MAWNHSAAALTLLAALASPAATAAKAEYAEMVGHDYKADIRYFVTWVPTAPKWYIGPCVAHEANAAKPVQLLQVDQPYKADVEVQLVENKFFAERVLCLK